MSRFAEGIQSFRKSGLFQELIPMEAGIGWPMPLRRAGAVYLKLILFGQANSEEKGKVALFAPFGLVILGWNNFKVVSYTNFNYENPWPERPISGQVGIFPHPQISHLTVGEYKEQRQILYSQFDHLFEALATGVTRSETDDETLRDLFSKMVEPSLLPYYRALAPKFIDRFYRAT